MMVGGYRQPEWKLNNFKIKPTVKSKCLKQLYNVWINPKRVLRKQKNQLDSTEFGRIDLIIMTTLAKCLVLFFIA